MEGTWEDELLGTERKHRQIFAAKDAGGGRREVRRRW